MIAAKKTQKKKTQGSLRELQNVCSTLNNLLHLQTVWCTGMENKVVLKHLIFSKLKHFADFKHFPFHSELKLAKATTVFSKFFFLTLL